MGMNILMRVVAGISIFLTYVMELKHKFFQNKLGNATQKFDSCQFGRFPSVNTSVQNME